jgi:hypothetical protein
MELTELDGLVERISEKNEALKQAKLLLQGLNGSSRALHNYYHAGMYLIMGGEAELGLESVALGVKANTELCGFGLAGETPPGAETKRILEALNKHKDELPGLFRSVIQGYDCFVSRNVCEGLSRARCLSDGPDKRAKFYRGLLGLVVMEQAYQRSIPFVEACLIKTYLERSPSLGLQAYELLDGKSFK